MWLALVATIASPVALNAVNLYRLATDRLGLIGPAAWALPVTLDGAALVALLVRLRALRDGDSAPGASLAVVAFAGVSAWLAAVEGWAVGGVVGALALGVLPIVAVVMLDLTVASVRRGDARAAGLLPGRAPVYSGLRSVLAPVSTARAWRYGVLWEVSDRRTCLSATHPSPPRDRASGHPAAATSSSTYGPRVTGPTRRAGRLLRRGCSWPSDRHDRGRRITGQGPRSRPRSGIRTGAGTYDGAGLPWLAEQAHGHP